MTADEMRISDWSSDVCSSDLLGRPLHVYDRAKIKGALVARAATAGETVLALNGKTYTLDAGMTVIADDVQAHDIGGVMGGEDSGVIDSTTDVLIECAYFDPDHVARTGQKLGLTSADRKSTRLNSSH